MRNEVFCGSLVLGLTAALGLLGCTQEAPVDSTPPFPGGTGQLPSGVSPYAPGPYGISKGSTVENFELVGFPNAISDTSGLRIIKLADFYNPTGTEVFPEGSPYGAGEPKPKALLVVVSSVWCGPCNYEADEVLPGLYTNYQPKGGEFLLALADGPTAGVPAVSKNLFQWTTKYEVNYPSVIDPSNKLAALFEADAFPANIIVRTKDMKIMEVTSGAPPAGTTFWKTFEGILAGKL
jgi:AhpC/TSA family protein